MHYNLRIIKKNKIKTIIVSSAILILVFIVLFSRSLDSLIASGIRKYGSEITGVDVKVSSVALSTATGSMTIFGFSMDNPKKYEATRALKLGEISVMIDPATITSPVVRIRQVNLIEPEISYETRSGINNFDAIQKNVNQYIADHFGSTNAKDKASSKKIVIDHLVIKNAKVTISSVLTAGRSITLPMPDLYLNGIGKDSNGATPAVVTKQVLNALTQSVTRIAGSALGGVIQGAGTGAKAVGNTLKNLFR